MATSLRDWAKQLGLDVNWSDKTKNVKVGDLSFQAGQGRQYGIEFDNNSTHYVTNEELLKHALGLNQPTVVQEPETPKTPNVQAPRETTQAPSYTAPSYDFAQTINDLYERERQARLLALQNQLFEQQAAVERQRIALAPRFQQERVQTDTASQVAGKRLAEVMANRGLDRGGENITANVGLQTARQQAMSDIGQRETTKNAELDQRIADLAVARQGDIAQMEAAVAADRTRAQLGNAYDERDFGYRQYLDSLSNYWRGRDFDYQAGRDAIGDNRWREQFDWQKDTYNREWDWQTDVNNPVYQRQMLDLEIARIQASSLPEQQKLELERLRQQIQAGNVDIATANEQLKRLKQGLPMNPSAGGGGSGGSSAEKGPTAQEWENSIYSSIDDFLDKGDYKGARSWLMERRDMIRSVLGQKKLDELFDYADR